MVKKCCPIVKMTNTDAQQIGECQESNNKKLLCDQLLNINFTN